MESGANPSSFAVLCFPDSKQVTIYFGDDREFSSRRIAKPWFELTTSRQLSASVPHNRVVLTTRSRHFAPGRVAQSVGHLTRKSEFLGSIPGWPHTFILLPLIQEGQLSVTGESMCTKYWLSA